MVCCAFCVVSMYLVDDCIHSTHVQEYRACEWKNDVSLSLYFVICVQVHAAFLFTLSSLAQSIVHRPSSWVKYENCMCTLPSRSFYDIISIATAASVADDVILQSLDGTAPRGHK